MQTLLAIATCRGLAAGLDEAGVGRCQRIAKWHTVSAPHRPARTDRKAVRRHARSVRLLSVTCIAVEVRDLAKRTHTHVAPMRVDDALEERSVTNTAEAHETQNRSYKASRRHGSSIGTAGRFARKVAPAWRTVDQISEELDGPVLQILTKRRTPHLPT